MLLDSERDWWLHIEFYSFSTYYLLVIHISKYICMNLQLKLGSVPSLALVLLPLALSPVFFFLYLVQSQAWLPSALFGCSSSAWCSFGLAWPRLWSPFHDSCSVSHSVSGMAPVCYCPGYLGSSWSGFGFDSLDQISSSQLQLRSNSAPCSLACCYCLFGWALSFGTHKSHSSKQIMRIILI